MEITPYFQRSTSGDLKTESMYLRLSECKLIFNDKNGDPITIGDGSQLHSHNWYIEHPLIDPRYVCNANIDLNYNKDTTEQLIRIEIFIPHQTRIPPIKDSTLGLNNMDILEEFEKPLMAELFEKCPDIDVFEKVSSLAVDSSDKNKFGSYKEHLRDVWIGSIKMVFHQSLGKHHPIVWLKFQDGKLEIGVVEKPTDTYEYSNPKQFDVDKIAETINRITLAYCRVQRKKQEKRNER